MGLSISFCFLFTLLYRVGYSLSYSIYMAVWHWRWRYTLYEWTGGHLGLLSWNGIGVVGSTWLANLVVGYTLYVA
jgi:hypothetical protein